jgi:hypothetical protein
MPNTRVPHEYAELLDRIGASISNSARVHLVTASPRAAHAFALRHEETTTTERGKTGWLEALSPELEYVDQPPTDTDHVVICEPPNAETVESTLASVPDDVPCDCIVGNPYSFNRIADRALSQWCSPIATWRTLRDNGYHVTIEGMHSVRSLTHSFLGRAWKALGHTDKRDVRTHRMRAAYREAALPLALTSCFVHFSGVPTHGE